MEFSVASLGDAMLVDAALVGAVFVGASSPRTVRLFFVSELLRTACAPDVTGSNEDVETAACAAAVTRPVRSSRVVFVCARWVVVEGFGIEASIRGVRVSDA